MKVCNSFFTFWKLHKCQHSSNVNWTYFIIYNSDDSCTFKSRPFKYLSYEHTLVRRNFDHLHLHFFHPNTGQMTSWKVIGRISSRLCTPVQCKELRWSRLKSAKQKVMKKDKAGSCCTHTGHPADVLQDRKFYYPLRLSLGGNFSTQDHISAFASSLSKQKGQELMTLCLFSPFPNCIFVSSSHHVAYCWQQLSPSTPSNMDCQLLC